MTNPLVAFLIELINRLKLKSPTFFKVFTWIGIVATLVTGLPGALEYFGVHLPAALSVLADKTVAYAALVLTIISKLTVADATQIAKTTDKLPLTENDKR